MANLQDYVIWRGDLSFAERPLTELDNLVLCQLSYIDMSSVFPHGEVIALRDVVQALLDRGGIRTLVADGEEKHDEYEEFARAAAASRRFGSLLMTNYEDILDPQQQIQFSAVTFRISRDTAFIAFRGTDDSLVGWKEDFMLSFEKIPAQEQALSYLMRVMQPDLRYYIGGHSKGANLALYASCLLPKEQFGQLLHVYVNDGPGLCPDVLDTSVIERIDPITTKIVPEYDVIGKIFEMPITDNRIVRSNARGILQHGILTWQLRDAGLDLVSSNAPGSMWIGQVLDQWIGGVSNVEDRRTFVNDLFDTIGACGITNFNELSGVGPDGLERMLGTVSHISPVTLDVARARPVAAVTGQKSQDTWTYRLSNLLKNSVLTRALLLIVSGLCAMLIPNELLPLSIAIGMTAFAAFELVYTFRRLKALHWDLKAMQAQAFICLASIAIYLMILIKDGALMLLSNAIFGTLFLLMAYHIADRIKGQKKHSFRFFWSIAEAVLLTLMAIFILIAPSGAVGSFTFGTGIVCFADGILHLADAISQRRRGPAE